MLLFFFFQAEDGIRDRDVTGVQTCAFRSPTSAIDVHPAGYNKSRLTNGFADEQVGSASGGDGAWHSMVWRGSASTAVDLHEIVRASCRERVRRSNVGVSVA